ncbi:hypothetical protein GLOTRDRAFT_118337 [Gloeophyllum trabeum ATCC 11539]|uniref:FHA domain-containing protein n=1 Tax=Gloeophyllum trabeum (strain ATCC 11539 / FP-39264 / Madison 617) TaxID=670483 RepID=S7R7N5_GLOTA|nr:uncharacterized protein GLOTRDRAFT_118337 [Gloeophyllum trabeum ATCC 11539]EPQ50380.1 hypothetical protein GLOTRDRAFT_118337 [Gloeophyllum trabeum ATCC 11539]
MPAPAPFSQPAWPALYLYPLNDSFAPKHISLANGQRVKIGRQTNAKTVPAERNGYFDSKVLSRQHAEVWEEGGKIYIKDVKSSNGTFINSERLSGEGLESEPFELKTDDIVEFGIDIVGEDNKTIIHHKVAARAFCVFSEADLQAAQRAEQQQGSSSGFVSIAQAPSGSGGPFNFGTGAGGANQPRRPTLQQQGISGMGGMGGSMRPPGKSGLTFDHILSRLQNELQKSRDTGSELHSLSDAMNSVHDTLGGAVAPSLPPHPHSLPPVRPASEPSTLNEQQGPTETLRELQAQLHETQSSIAGHVDKMRTLENMLAEHEAIKREINSLRELLEDRKQHQDGPSKHHDRDGRQERDYSYDDDDAASVRSVDTIRGHELERVEEENEDQLQAEEDDEERRRRREELGRPRTPEPTGIHEDEDDEGVRRRSSGIPDNLTQRLTTLSNQLESALELSRSLQAQHVAAQSTIAALESKVGALETMIQTTQAEMQASRQAQEEARAAAEAARVPDEEHVRERESLTALLNEWKKSVEGQWTGVQEEWHQERERLRKAREEFEVRTKAVEEKIASAVSRLDGGLAKLHFQASQNLPTNGDARVSPGGGLVTPPSPRSVSSDSLRSRQRRKRANGSRGRSSSRSRSRNGTGGSTSSDSLADGENIAIPRSLSSPKSRPRSPWISDDSSDSEESHKAAGKEKEGSSQAEYPMTPESSTLLPRPSLAEPSAQQQQQQQPSSSKPQPDMVRRPRLPLARPDRLIWDFCWQHFAQVSTAVGVLVLSVAAAAVIWRVKSE